jgi:regulator of nucleoside diphosphate kinase
MLFKKKKYMITRLNYNRLLEIIDSISPEDSCVIKIREKLKHARIIEPEEINPNIITMNTKFRLKNLGNGSRNEFELVFPEQQTPEKNHISVFEFLGTEVLCHEVGEIIPSANRDCFFLIENIIYQPEAAGNSGL